MQEDRTVSDGVLHRHPDGTEHRHFTAGATIGKQTIPDADGSEQHTHGTVGIGSDPATDPANLEPCIACGAPVTADSDGHDDGCATIADRTFTGREVLDAIAAATDAPAYIEQTGGGTATLYIGATRAAIGFDADEPRYRLAAGPGSFDWGDSDRSTFYASDLYIGPDDDGSDLDQHREPQSLPAVTRAVRDLLAEPDWRIARYGTATVTNVLPGTPEWDESERALVDQRRRGE